MISVKIKKDATLIIGPIQAEDISTVLNIDHKINGRQSSLTYDDLITGSLNDKLNLNIIAEVEGKGVGFLIAHQAYEGEPVKEAGLIQVIGIDPDHWGQGIGSMLVKALEENCKSKGIKQVRVMVKYEGGQLQKFFKIIGYHAGQLIDYNKVIK